MASNKNNKGKSSNKNKINSLKNSDRNSKDLEVTTKIRVDKNRINDSDSLDTSFLDGRIQKKAEDNKKIKDKILEEKKDYSSYLNVIKNIFYYLFAICIFIVVIFILLRNHPFTSLNVNDSQVKDDSLSQETREIEKGEIDRNYLFV